MGIYRGRGVGGCGPTRRENPHAKKGWGRTAAYGGFPTLPLGPTSRIVYVSKLRKTQWEKYGERAHSIRLLMLHELPH